MNFNIFLFLFLFFFSDLILLSLRSKLVSFMNFTVMNRNRTSLHSRYQYSTEITRNVNYRKSVKEPRRQTPRISSKSYTNNAIISK